MSSNPSSISELSSRFVRYVRANPGSAFIITFELVLIGIVIELWTGNHGLADELGVIAFIIVFVGVVLQTIISARSKSDASIMGPARQ